MKKLLYVIGALLLSVSPLWAQSFPQYVNSRQPFSSAGPPSFLSTDMIALVRGNTTYRVPATQFAGGGGGGSGTVNNCAFTDTLAYYAGPGNSVSCLSTTGTAGQVLTSAGPSNPPAWQTLAGGGNVSTSGSLTTNAVIIGTGGTGVNALASLGTTGQVLTSNGGGSPPSFQTISAGGSGTVGNCTTADALAYYAATGTTTSCLGSVGTTGQLLSSQGPGLPPQWITASGTGTVTSIGFSVPTGILSVTGSPVTTAGTITLSTTGTSGGIPYFSSNSVLSSSALLTSNALVKGGGSGVAPASSKITENGSQTTINYNAAALPAPPAQTTVQIGSLDNNSTKFVLDTFGTAVFQGSVTGRGARGTAASPTASLSGDIPIAMNMIGRGATGYSAAPRAAVSLDICENWSDTAQCGKVLFTTTAAGGTATATNAAVGSGAMPFEAPAGSPLAGFIDNATNTVTVTTTGTTAATTRREIIGTLSASITRTLPAIGTSGLAIDSTICYDDNGLNVTPTNNLTIKGNTLDGINGGSVGGSIGPFTSLTSNCFRVAGAHNWAQTDGVQTANCATNQFVNQLNVNGILPCAQPDFSNLSGTPTVTQLGATPVSSGVLTDVAGVATWVVPAGGSGTTPNWLMTGCTISRSSASVIAVAACQAIDATNTTVMTAAAFTKSLSGSWVAGSAQNGMGNGLTVANDTWYWLCMVHNTTPVTDYYIDTSASCANIPTGLNTNTPVKRPIWPFKTCSARSLGCSTTASTNIDPFFQAGRKFVWNSAQLDANNQTYTNTPTAVTLTVPPSQKIDVNTILYVSNLQAGNITLYDADDTTNPVNSPGFTSCTISITSIPTSTVASCQVPVTTNTSAQINAYGSASLAANYINTVSYTMPERALAAY